MLVQGIVQGVGFRFFTEHAAAREGINGWVRNVADGRVEIEAEGEAESLERFEHRIRHGPSGARVEHVEVTDAATGQHNSGFAIR